MRHAVRRPLVVALALLLLIPFAQVQAQVTTATLVGLVRDSSQAVIPGTRYAILAGNRSAALR